MSFGFACKGLAALLASQRNARIHAAATAIVAAAGFYFNLGLTQWCLIILSVAAVWTAEALNTALEFLADAVSPDDHPLIGKAKDIAAGAVFLTALGAVLVGVLVFGKAVADRF